MSLSWLRCPPVRNQYRLSCECPPVHVRPYASQSLMRVGAMYGRTSRTGGRVRADISYGRTCTGGHLVRADVYGRTFRTGGRVWADISYGLTRTGGRSVRADVYGSGSLDGRTWSKKYVFEVGVIPYHCVPCPSSLPLSHLIRVIISYPTPFTQHSL